MTENGGELEPGPAAPLLRLRPVREEDCRLLWEWANDPDVRALSFHSGSISWDEHLAWFHRTLGDSSVALYLVQDKDDRPVGVVRFTGDGRGSAVVSITIAGESRGRGFGGEALVSGVQAYLKDTGIRVLHAYIKRENTRSIKTFRHAGFRSTGLVEREGQMVYEMVLKG